jgi:hypothetical protein
MKKLGVGLRVGKLALIKHQRYAYRWQQRLYLFAGALTPILPHRAKCSFHFGGEGTLVA